MNYHVHGELEVGEEAGEALLGVADEDGVDGPGAFDPPGERLLLDAGDDAGPHDDAGDANAGELPRQRHLPERLGEDVGVGPAELPGPGEAQLLHGLPLVLLLRVVAGDLPLVVTGQPQLGVDVQLRLRLPQRLALLERPLLDHPLLLAHHIGCHAWPIAVSVSLIFLHLIDHQQIINYTVLLITRGHMEDDLEIGALLGELANMFHSHHVHIQGHVVPAHSTHIINHSTFLIADFSYHLQLQGRSVSQNSEQSIDDHPVLHMERIYTVYTYVSGK